MQQKYSLSFFWRIVLGSLAIFFSLQTVGNVFNILTNPSINNFVKEDSIIHFLNLLSILIYLIDLAAMILLVVYIFTINQNTRLKLNIILWLKASFLLLNAIYFVISNNSYNFAKNFSFRIILLLSSYIIPAILFCVMAIIIKKKLTGKSIRLLAIFTIISAFINYPLILQLLFNQTLPIIIFPLLLLNIKNEQEGEEKEADDWDSFLQALNVKHRIIFGFAACILLLYRLNTVFSVLFQRTKVYYKEISIAKVSELNIIYMLNIITALLEVAALGFFAVYIFNLHKSKDKKLLSNALYLQCAAMVLYFLFYQMRYNVAVQLNNFIRAYCNALSISAIISLLIAAWFLIFASLKRKRVSFKTDERLPSVLIIIIALIPLVYFTIWDTNNFNNSISITKLISYIPSFLTVAIFPILFIFFPKGENEVETITEVSTEE